MKTLKSAAESIIRRCRGTGHRTKLIKRPAILILIAIMITTSVLSPSGLTLGSGGLSPVPVKAAGAEDGTSSGEADNAESSTGSAREETGNTDAGASESEGEKEDKDNTASDVKKGGNDAASQDQGGDTGIAEDAGKGDHEEKSGSANGSSDKKNNETKDAAADSDKSGKKGNEAAGAGSGEKNTSKDSGSGRKNSSDRDNVSENGTQGTTAPENDEIILTETARDKSYTITVRGDKYSGLKNVDKMTVLEITKDDQFYEEFVKKLNKTLNKTTEGQIQDIRLYDIEFTDQNGLPVHLKRNVDVTITYNNYKASPKVEMNQVVRAFIATTVTYYGFFTNVTTSFAKAYASGAGARVSRTVMTGNTAAADPQIKISKTEWIDEKETLTDISRNRVNEVTYVLPKDGVTGIAVIGKDPEVKKPEQGQGQTGDKTEAGKEAQTEDKNEAGKEVQPEDKSEAGTEAQTEDKSEAATEAQPGDKSETGKENQPEGENGDGQDSQTGTQKEENSEARTADQTQTSPETQTAAQPETGPEAQTGDQNEAGQETQPEKTLTVKEKDYRVTVTYDDKAGLPEGARLTAREIGDYSRSYKNYLSQAESALTKDKQVNTARFFDITIWDGAGNKIEPKAPVRVSIEFDSVDVQDKGNVELIHFEEDKKNAGAGSGKAQILHDVEVQDGEKKDTVDGVSFDIGGFSVFGVLQTVQVLKMTASDGKQYKVTVTYDDTCGIPADAKLIVNEISKTDKRYNDYVDKTAETLGKDAGQFSYAHALDIMLVGQVTGKHYQPTKDVKVSIELLKEDISEDQDVNVVHFQGDEKNTASRMDSKVDEGSVEFETDGFSVYVVVTTVKQQILEAPDGQNYRVTVEYDSTSGIPADAELQVSELNEKSPFFTEYVEKTAETLGKDAESFAFAHAFDIKLVDPESGEKYQPNKDVKVSIELLTEDLTENDELAVVHFKGDVNGETENQGEKGESNTEKPSETTPEVIDATVNRDGVVEFETDGFSVYVLTASTYLGTYQFYSYNSFGDYQGYNFTDDQGNYVNSQTIKNGEKLVAPHDSPINPNNPSAEFKGWYLGTGDPTNPTLEEKAFDFDKQQDISSDETFYLYAVFANYAHVIFHSQYDSTSQTDPVLEIIPVELTSDTVAVDISGVTAAYYSTSETNHYEFYGWSITPFHTPGEGTAEIITNTTAYEVSCDINLYPVYKQVHYLKFSSGSSGTSATYYSPVGIPATERLLQSDIQTNYIPERPGYTFQGWYLGVETDENGNQNGIGKQVTTANGSLCTLNESEIQTTTGDDGYLLLSTDVTLYAKWEATDVNYTIVVWKQRKTKDAYDWAESFALKAEPYTRVAVDEVYRSLNDNDKYNETHPSSPIGEDKTNPYSDYNFDSVTTGSGKDETAATPASTQEVEFKGTTVFNLYYDYKGSQKSPGTTGHTITRVYGSESFDSITATAGTLLSSLELGTSTETKTGYTFAWYLDESHTKAIDNTTTMPDDDLTIYGKWSIKRITIHIDTNYGALYGLEGASGTGATYFKFDYGESVEEYSHVMREYVPSESGNYYFVNHDWNGSYPDRKTYYTTDISKATELTTFKREPGTYFAEGWYVQEPDGSETLFDFSNQNNYNFEEHLVNDVFTLKLHWKMAGTYYLQYNTDVTTDGERLIGTLSDDSVQPNSAGYRDQANITIGGRAVAPDEYAFVGWTIRGDDSGKVYYPGEDFTLLGEYAVTVNGKKTVYLDAVYQQIKTAKIIYDANGGTISNSADSGYPYKMGSDGTPVLDDDSNPENLNTHKVARDTDKGTVTVSGLVNNSPVKLSSGEGFTVPTGSNASLTGWNTKPDGSGKHYDLGSYQTSNGPIYVDINDPITLYAEWQITVYFNKNDGDATFSESGWNGYIPINDSESEHNGEYAKETYVNATLKEPEGTVTNPNGSFDFWSKTSDGDQENAFEFDDEKLIGEITLFAHYTEAVKVPYHVVSTNKVDWDSWRKTDTLRVTTEGLDLSASANLSSYVTAETGYTYSYACLSASKSNISEENKITGVRIDNGEIKVKTADNTDVVLDINTGLDRQGRSIFLVYATENSDKRVKLAYVKEGESGALSNVVGVEEGKITYNGSEFSSLNTELVSNVLNNAAVANGSIAKDDQDIETIAGQILTLSDTALEISQNVASDVFNAPPLLDDGTSQLALVYDTFGVSSSDPLTNISGIVGSAKKLYLRYYDGKRQWSEDKTTWTTFTGDTLYVVYRPRGVELEITKAVTGDNTGISADESFAVKVTSTAITRTSYNVEGTGYGTVSATPASGETPGSIDLTVKDGSDIKISGLGNGSYTITETHNANYTLNARVDNNAVEVTDDKSVTVTLNQDTKVDLLNTPDVLCKILDTSAGGYKTFYTLNKALEYAGTNMDGEAKIQMLRDYVLPSWDALEIPTGYDITITSGGTEKKSITRDAAATTSAMLTNYGTLTLKDITFDGTDVESRSSMVRNSGELIIDSGATFSNANRTIGSGSAIYQTQGTLTINDDASFTGNSSTNGGAIYIYSGIVDINGGTFSSNIATGNGGVLYYAGSDTVTVSGGTFENNNAVNGGAIYASGGSITMSDGAFRKNSVLESGGAVYSDSGTASITGGTVSGNTASQDGGAIYSGTGSVSLSGGTISGNTATSGNGGAICSDAGTVSITAGMISGNYASSGNGGAVYSGSGTVEMSGGTIGGTEDGTANNANNGAGVYVNTGSATFSAGTITGNTATEGGAVGVESADARLFFSGNISITGNKMDTDESNVYLNLDADDVINIAGLGGNASIGIYVSDGVILSRGVPGAKFATYTDDTNKAKITNDRDKFDVVSETEAKKLYWGKAITVVVRYQKTSYATQLPPQWNKTGNDYKTVTITNYYPVMGDDGYIAISALAENLYTTKTSELSPLGLSGSAAYGGSWISNASSFDDYVTKLTWDSSNKEWKLTKHDDTTTQALENYNLIVYYAEPAYISIENNTDMTLTISDLKLTVGSEDKNVINSPSSAGYGMVYAKNGAIRSALLPVESSDLVLGADKSINLLIPGGRNMSYSLDGSFETSTEETVTLRTTNAAGTALDSIDLTVGTDGSFTFPSGKKTLNKAGTYQIIFGDDKMICKITTTDVNDDNVNNYCLTHTDADSSGKVEYVFKSLNQAISFVQTYMSSSKTATIEMLTDYLLPFSDNMNVPQGYNITLTTATSGTYYYSPVEKYSQKEGKTITESRVTISRDSDNKISMITVTTGNESTFLTLENLIIDGKSVQGSSDGGAVSTKNCGVTVKNAEFLNVYASNGGALYVVSDMGKANSWLSVQDSYFYKCNSTKATGNRLGGGAIHAWVNDLTLTDCDFYSCEAADQAGAVFHRIDGNIDSSATISGCTFDNCRAKAAGGLELDSKNIMVSGCTFEHCVATERNGGGFNIYVGNTKEPSFYCTTTVSNCTFTDCHITGKKNNDAGHGGGFRSNSKETTVVNCTFTNTTTTMYGGGVAFSNPNATKAEVQDCTFDKCTASMKNQSSQGGGIYCRAKVLNVYDTEVKNCDSLSDGGGIYHNNNGDGSSAAISNTTLQNCVSTNGAGGGIRTNARTVTVTESSIQNNRAKGNGGGICDNASADGYYLIVENTEIKNNTTGNKGGGVYSDSRLTMINATVTENRLSTSTKEDGAGIWIYRLLTVGKADASDPDTTTVKDNTTASGTASDLRLKARSNSDNRAATDSVSVLNSLSGENDMIRVVNPGNAGDQFGTRANNNLSGFTEGQHVFAANSGGLYGVYNRNDETKLIWRGGAICKLTDASGHLLYLDAECNDPAVFDRLDDRTKDGSKLSPFSYLRQTNVSLYREGDTGAIDLTSEAIQIKMLVNSFETGTWIITGSYAGRTMLTLTTASSTDTDGYPYTGRAGSYATILRGYTDNGKSLIETGVNLTLRNITIDGGSADKTSPKTTTASGGLINAKVSGTTVTLSSNSVLQNCTISNGNSGAGVFVDSDASLIIAGGAIYNCKTSSGEGGGVRKSGENGKLEFSSGIISNCSAKNGGGVYFVKGTSGFSMSGTAQITGCTAMNEGGGVWLNEQKTMTMSGGSITGNHAGTAGGGIFMKYHKSSRLNLSSRVTVSGNTCGDTEYDCNVQLGTESNNPTTNNQGVNEWNGIINSTGITRNSYIGIYVPGTESAGDDPVEKNTTVFDRHGIKTKPFGTYSGDTNYLYCFVNDRNGLKGGLQIGDTHNYIYWVEIFSLTVGKTVISGETTDLSEEFEFKVTFSTSEGGPAYYDFNSSDANNCYFTYDGSYNGKTDADGNPRTISIEHGEATVYLKNGESITVDNLPAEINNGHVYYKVEEILSDSRKEHYTTTTARSTNPSETGVLYVSGTIGENLNKEEVTSKYVSTAYFDNLNAICKLTSSANGGVLLNTLDAASGNYIPAVYSALHNDESTGAFDVINEETELFYWSRFTNRYERFSYTGDDTLSVEMLVEKYYMAKPVTLNSGLSATLTTAENSSATTDGYPYVGRNGTQATIFRSTSVGNDKRMFTAEGSLTLLGVTLDGNNESCKNVSVAGGIAGVTTVNGILSVREGAILQNSTTKGSGGAVFVRNGTMSMDGGTIKDNIVKGYGGGAIRMENSAKVTISGGEIIGNKVQNNDANGGAISVRDGTLNISGGTISSNSVEWITGTSATPKAVGGAIYVHSSATATISGGEISGNTVKDNSESSFGGAIYVDGGKLTLSGGTFNGNTADTDGAAIYLTDSTSTKLFISGNPIFGDNSDANTVVITNSEDETNGDVSVYTDNKVRQDIYLAEAHENAPASIEIMGDLTGDEGSIWVYANSELHYKTLTPFAKFGTGVVFAEEPATGQYNSEHLKVFRNAQYDSLTENPLSQTPKYLYGMVKDGDATYVYWYGVEGSRKVILRKVEEDTYKSLQGGKFIIYSNSGMTSIAKDADGNSLGTEADPLTAGAGGAFYVGTLNYGTYYVKELEAPSGHTAPASGYAFIITVNADGVGYETTDSSGNKSYSREVEASQATQP